MVVLRKKMIRGAVLLLGICLMGAGSASAKAVDVIGVWEGAITIQGSELGITVEFVTGDSGLTGDIDIPIQKIKDMPLTNIKLDSAKITFDMSGTPGETKFSGTVAEDGKIIAGDFTQAEGTFPFTLTKREAVPPPDSTVAAKANMPPKLKIEPEKVTKKEKTVPVEYTTNASGLQWRDLTVGEGAEAVKGKTVDVHYTGWLYVDGKKGNKFDSSVDRGKPFSFSLGAGRVIKGWDEGVAGMKVGGKRQLLIPPDLGYGARGYPPVIPENSTLLFDVELLNVK